VAPTIPTVYCCGGDVDDDVADVAPRDVIRRRCRCRCCCRRMEGNDDNDDDDDTNEEKDDSVPAATRLNKIGC
jgi:hypothetical protein